MEAGNNFSRGKPISNDSSGKINNTETTETMLEWFSEFEISRLKSIENAIQRAKDLANELGLVHVMTSFIIDTGAGLSLRCYAKGLSTREISDLHLMSDNGPLSANKVTIVQFRTMQN